MKESPKERRRVQLSIFRECFGQALAATPITISDQSISDQSISHSQGSTEFLTEPSFSQDLEDSKNLFEYLQELEGTGLFKEGEKNAFLDLLRQRLAADQEGSEMEIGKRLESLLESNEFFHNFLLRFKSLIAEKYAFYENYRFKDLVIMIPPTIPCPEGMTIRKGARDYCGKERFENDFVLKVDDEDLGLPIAVSETIGVNLDRKQEDGFVLMKCKDIGSKRAPKVLQEFFREIGEEARKVGYDAFLEAKSLLDREFILNENNSEKIDEANKVAFLGSTAVVVHCASDQLTVANCGDSRALLFVIGSNKEVGCMRLSKDQGPEDLIERERLAKCGAVVTGQGRVQGKKGTLSIARSLGDSTYHKDGPNGRPIFHISFDPDLTQFDLGEINSKYSPSKLLLVLACDGLFEPPNTTEWHLSRAIKDFYESPSLKEAHNVGDELASIAHYLRSCALHNGSLDNITVVVADVTKPPKEGEVLVGVFDGHGGEGLSRSLPGKFKERFLKPGKTIIDQDNHEEYLLKPSHSAAQAVDESTVSEESEYNSSPTFIYAEAQAQEEEDVVAEEEEDVVVTGKRRRSAEEPGELKEPGELEEPGEFPKPTKSCRVSGEEAKGRS